MIEALREMAVIFHAFCILLDGMYKVKAEAEAEAEAEVKFTR